MTTSRRTCSLPRCRSPHLARGFCTKHYNRWKKYGDPCKTKVIVGNDVARFWSKVDKRGPSECWLWTGAPLQIGGYGRFSVGGTSYQAHRYSYALAFGPVPDDLTIDHVKARGCTSRLCVNPAHLEPVTAGVNALRGDGPPALNATKTHCKRDHEFTPENTLLIPRDGGVRRQCRTCKREYERAHPRDRRRRVA